MKAKNRLRILRAERRVTQMRLALKVKMQPAKLSHIENDLIQPSDEERRALARALGVSLEEAFPEAVNA